MPEIQKHSTSPRLDWFLVGYFVLLEILVFGPFVSKIGFYLDDWLMLSTFSGGPQDVLGAFSNYFFNDPKVIIRPVEVLHFGLLYFLFGTRPLGYHLVNCGLEICVSVLLYCALKRFTGSRFLAFAATCAFILYPVRDCTHYWILCSSVALSLALYFVSLILALNALQEKKKMLYLLGAMPFALSIFNYEVFMPFACVTAVCVFLKSLRGNPIRKSFIEAIYSFLPLFFSGLALFVYQRFIVPQLGIGYLHRVAIDPLQILHVIGAGSFVSSPLSVLPFAQSQISILLMNPISPFEFVFLCLIAVSTFLTYFYLLKSDSESVIDRRRACFELLAVGAVAIVASLSIFGLNKEYEPTLFTLVNRIFTGASFGWASIFSAALLLTLLPFGVKSGWHPSTIKVFSSALAVFAVYLTIVNWQLAQSWVISHNAQKDVVYQVRKLREKIKYPDVLILCDFPRYVMWSPIFDGIWDFQSMVRVILKEPKLQAGVLSDRLCMEKHQIKDVSVGYTCAAYPVKQIKMFIPCKDRLVSVSSAREFVSIAERNSAQSMLSPGTIEKWSKQIEASEK